MCRQGKGMPTSVLDVKLAFQVRSEKGLTPEEEAEAGATVPEGAPGNGHFPVRKSSSAGDPFSLSTHAFRYVARIHEVPSPGFITASTKSLLISLRVYSLDSVIISTRLSPGSNLPYRAISDSKSCRENDGAEAEEPRKKLGEGTREGGDGDVFPVAGSVGRRKG